METLRRATAEDAAVFAGFEADPVACALAVWPARDRSEREQHWRGLIADPVVQTIVTDDAVAGYVAAFSRKNRREVCYWVGRAYWNRGLASRALAALLSLEPARPLWASVAESNRPSSLVLEKCGFRPDRRQIADDGVAEVLLKLE